MKNHRRDGETFSANVSERSTALGLKSWRLPEKVKSQHDSKADVSLFAKGDAQGLPCIKMLLVVGVLFFRVADYRNGFRPRPSCNTSMIKTFSPSLFDLLC